MKAKYIAALVVLICGIALVVFTPSSTESFGDTTLVPCDNVEASKLAFSCNGAEIEVASDGVRTNWIYFSMKITGLIITLVAGIYIFVALYRRLFVTLFNSK